MQILIDKKQREAFTMDFMLLMQKYNFQNILKTTNLPSLQDLRFQNNSISNSQTSGKTDSFVCELASNLTTDSEETKPSVSLANQSKKIIKQTVEVGEARASSKGRLWTLEEDSQLIRLVAQYGQKWAILANMMPGKERKQLRDRYVKALSPGINWSDWTKEEESQFEILHKRFGNKWCEIAAHLPGRTENQVKNKYYWGQRQKPLGKSAYGKKSRTNIHRKDVESNLDFEMKESEQKLATLNLPTDSVTQSSEMISEQISPSNTDWSEKSARDNMNMLVEYEADYWPNNISQQDDLAYLYQEVDAFFSF